MKHWMVIGLVALLPLTANAGAMRCKNTLISDGDAAFNVLRSCGQPLMKEDIIDTRLLDTPKIGERWTYQKSEADIPQQVTVINDRVESIMDIPR